DPGAHRRLSDRRGLPVAVGHRLVLVLAGVRGAASDGTAAVAPPVAPLRRVPPVGGARPPPPALRPVVSATGTTGAGGRDPGRGAAGRPDRRLPGVLPRGDRHQPDLAVPAAAARRPPGAAVPADAGRAVRQPRLLVHGAAGRGSTGRVPQPADRAGGRRTRRPQVALLHRVLPAGGVLAPIQRAGVRRGQTGVRPG